MNNAFAALSADDRKLALDDAALRMEMEPVILEKDFWVSWLLGLLFTRPELAPYLVFKGGTSLSKVFGAITWSGMTCLSGRARANPIS